METYKLSGEEYQSTFSAPLKEVTTTATNVIDIWPYVASVPFTDLQGHEVYDQFVECVYRFASDRFDHVLVMTKTVNVYLVIVVDNDNDCIYGHCILNLNEKYGLNTAAVANS